MGVRGWFPDSLTVRLRVYGEVTIGNVPGEKVGREGQGQALFYSEETHKRGACAVNTHVRHTYVA